MQNESNNYESPGTAYYVASLLVPPFSIIAAIASWAHGLVGPGLALIATGFLGFWVFWPVVIFTLSAIVSSAH